MRPAGVLVAVVGAAVALGLVWRSAEVTLRAAIPLSGSARAAVDTCAPIELSVALKAIRRGLGTDCPVGWPAVGLTPTDHDAVHVWIRERVAESAPQEQVRLALTLRALGGEVPASAGPAIRGALGEASVRELIRDAPAEAPWLDPILADLRDTARADLRDVEDPRGLLLRGLAGWSPISTAARASLSAYALDRLEVAGRPPPGQAGSHAAATRAATAWQASGEDDPSSRQIAALELLTAAYRDDPEEAMQGRRAPDPVDTKPAAGVHAALRLAALHAVDGEARALADLDADGVAWLDRLAGWVRGHPDPALALRQLLTPIDPAVAAREVAPGPLGALANGAGAPCAIRSAAALVADLAAVRGRLTEAGFALGETELLPLAPCPHSGTPEEAALAEHRALHPARDEHPPR